VNVNSHMTQNAQSPSAPTTASGVAPAVAVLVPCYNEEITVGDVVRQFRAELPDAHIYVFDNNSSDRTIDEARAAGAVVFSERRQGKGYVVQTMFRNVDADIYVMVDGDATYSPAAVHELIAPVARGEADMVVGSRWHSLSQSEFKQMNRFGNRFFLFVVNSIFSVRLTDMLSGYRAFNRGFVKSVPLFSRGFEIETELTIKALEQGHRVVEIPIDLTNRPDGSFSKIRIARDGMIILNTILALFRDYKPLTFFGAIGILSALIGLASGIVVTWEFVETGLVVRLPLAVFAVGAVLAGMLLSTVGLVLHTIARRFRELNYQLRAFEDFTRRMEAARADADRDR
jgi:glycosyltransferase involved in cell wall biosynthesis